MRNHVDIDHTHSRAIIRELGERLRALLLQEPELPASLRTQLDRLRQLEHQESASIVPDKAEHQRACWRMRMTTVEKLLAQKQLLLERLEDDPGPHERDEIERLLAQIDAALNLIEENGPAGAEVTQC